MRFALQDRFVAFRDRFWDAFWKHNDDWELSQSNYYSLLAEESEEAADLAARGEALQDSDPAAAVALYIKAAEAGSVWAMNALALRAEPESAEGADLSVADHWYLKAIEHGSQMAMIYRARLLGEHRHWDECEQQLQLAMQQDLVAAWYWSARFRFHRNPTRETARAVRPLLEHAMAKGHPAAEAMLTRHMVRGKYGMLLRPKGLWLTIRRGLRHKFEL
jgi:TPR repeat protein